ncbi:hypothetical protein C5167_036142 [Papaver somniferum]|nr:hypothetical protein C5167_036142 [Papaver somniferum]
MHVTSFPFQWLFDIYLSVATFVVYLFVRSVQKKRLVAEDDEVAVSPPSSATTTKTAPISEQTVTELVKPIAHLVKPETPIPPEQQLGLYKWILEEKRKVKPISAEEKKKLDEEKAILEAFIQSKSNYAKEAKHTTIGKASHRLSRGIRDKVLVGVRRGSVCKQIMRLAVGILVAGFVFEEEDFMKPWEEKVGSKNLIALSTAIQDCLTSRIAFELMKQGATMTVLSTLLAALAWPATLLTATDLIDSKWSIAVDSFALNQVLHPRSKAAISVWIWLATAVLVANKQGRKAESVANPVADQESQRSLCRCEIMRHRVLKRQFAVRDRSATAYPLRILKNGVVTANY